MNVSKTSVSFHVDGESPSNENIVQFRKPQLEDGSAIWELVKDTGVLDLNSPYCYLVISQYFQETSIVAESNQKMVGFISAFICPDRPDTLFVWQVGVDASMRRQGIGLAMLQALFERKACDGIRFLETTISPDNGASERMFRRFAEFLGAGVQQREGFPANVFPGATHEDERLFHIGPRKT